MCTYSSRKHPVIRKLLLIIINFGTLLFSTLCLQHVAFQHAAFLNTLKPNKLTLLRCLAQTWLDWSALNEGKVEFGILRSWKQSDRLCYWARKIVWLVRNHEDDCENNLRQSVK